MYKYWGNRKITLCHELTKVHEEFIRLTLEEAVGYYENTLPKGEFVLIVEGKSEEELASEEKASWEQMSIEEHFNYHVSQGLSEKDAIKQVAKDRGLRKQDVYKEIKIAD
jgi:16S rRNA (cytidine1402-2'-O)-methyltransferase